MVFFPEGDEVEDLLSLFALAQVGVGITEGSALRVVRQKDQDARLTSTAGRHVMALDDGMFSKVGERVEIESEGGTRKDFFLSYLGVPGGQKFVGLGAVDAVGVLREVAFLGDGVEATEQCQSLVGGKCHDVALAFQRPEFECQASAQGMRSWDHLRAGQARGLSQLLNTKPKEIRQEEEQTAPAGGKAPRRQREAA